MQYWMNSKNVIIFHVEKNKDIEEMISFASMWNMDGIVIMAFCEDAYQRNICNLIVDNFEGGRQVSHYFREHYRHKVLCIADNKFKPDYDRYEGLCNRYQHQVDFLQIAMKKEERMSF